MHDRRKIIRYTAYAVSAAVLTAAAVSIASMDAEQPAPFAPCIFHAVTGLYCPGCGMFRLVYHLVHLRIGMAFACNPLGFIVLPCMIAALVLRRFRFGRILIAGVDRLAVTRALLWAVTVFWVLRNIPVFPFTLLAPMGAFL